MYATFSQNFENIYSSNRSETKL